MPDSGRGFPPGITPVASGFLAAVVTHLEMRQRPPPRASRLRKDLRLEHKPAPPTEWYRGLYSDIGADWLWFSRLELDDAALAAVVHDPAIEVYELTCEGERAGMLELDRRQPGEVEIAFFGLAGPFIGRGIGRFLMDEALERAWRGEVGRVWVHTCTFDHPGALAFYRRSGFVPCRREVEVVTDPRLRGVLPREAAPQHPIIA